VSLPHKDEGKLRLVNKLINQFASSMKHRPFNNDNDKARTLGFIHALRDVITQHGSKPVPKRLDYAPPPVWQEPSAESKALNMQEIQKIKDRLKKRDTDELDGQD
jgi:hypothetical protein